MRLELNEAERDELQTVLDRYLSEMKAELRRTETAAFHDRLSAETGVVRSLLEKVRGLAAAAAR